MTSVNRYVVLFNFIDYYHYLCTDIYKGMTPLAFLGFLELSVSDPYFARPILENRIILVMRK